MRSKVLIIACAALGGCSVGHGGEQIVHKDPATVYSAVETAFSAMADNGNNGSAAAKGQVATLEKVENKSLDLKIAIDGKQAMRLQFGFEPANGGKETKLTGDWDIDQGVIRDSIRKQGGDAAVPMLPQFALDLAMQKLLTEIATKIDNGEPLDTSRSALAMASGPSAAAAGNSEWERRAASARATAPTGSAAPMMDPDAAAESYLPSR